MMNKVFLMAGGKKQRFSFASCCLRYQPIDTDAACLLVKWRSDPQTIRYYRNPRPLTMEQHLKWYREKYLPDQTRYDWIVWLEEKPIGTVSLSNIDFEEGSAEIGYMIGESVFRGQGLSTEMITACMKFGKERLGLTTFTAEIHSENIASQKAIEKCGFSLETQADIFQLYKYSYGGGYRLTSLYFGAAWRRVLAA